MIKLPDGHKLTISREFIEWFRGFADAEGSFGLTINSNRYSFKFRIVLHSDDIEVLYYIRNILGIGNIYISKTNPAVTYNVVNKDGILIILAIFAKYNLNTTKHLNFLALAQAFWLYHINDNPKGRLKEIKLEIDKIKSSMNNNRTNFDMPSSHRFNISPHWLLGFTEGDGSFTYNRSSGTLYYKLSQKDNKDLFNAIIAYLYSLAPLDRFPDGMNNVVNLYQNKNTGVWVLDINHRTFLEFVIIPLFNSVVFRAKKGLDYFDWTAIFNIQKKGLHFTPEGNNLIDRILDQMNNNRLSTSGKPQINILGRVKLIEDITKLLSTPSNYEYQEDGKIHIISENRLLLPRGKRGKPVKVALISSEGNVINTFNSIGDCAKFLDIVPSTARNRLIKGLSFLFKNDLCFIKKLEE